jgi:hypothetical protein
MAVGEAVWVRDKANHLYMSAPVPRLRTWLALAALSALAGCAHPENAEYSPLPMSPGSGVAVAAPANGVAPALTGLVHGLDLSGIELGRDEQLAYERNGVPFEFANLPDLPAQETSLGRTVRNRLRLREPIYADRISDQEMRIAAMFAAKALGLLPATRRQPPGYYVCQMAGVRSEGRRYLVLNFLRSDLQGPSWREHFAYWQDGGHQFVQMSFDLEAGRLSRGKMNDYF